MNIGDSVRITITAGAVLKGSAYFATKFVGTVAPGTPGLYQGPMTGDLGAEGWHIVSYGAWDIALHESQFEPA